MRKRLFIALNLPLQVQEALEKVQNTFRIENRQVDVKWVKPGIIHLTLHFLGWVDEERVEAVKSLIGKAVKGIGLMPVRLGQLGCFPNRRCPRVVWVELEEGGGMLKKLHTQLREALLHAGFAVDKRPFTAHLTLGRLRAPQPLKGLDTPVPAIPFKVDYIDLMESILHRSGPEYIVLESYALHS